MKRSIRLFLFYGVCVLLNILPNRLVGALGIPLFIDNIGTILSAVLGGYLPGVLVGYATNILNMTASVENAYYAGISVLIALFAAFFARRGFFRSPWKCAVAVLVFAFLGGCLGSVLTYLIYGYGIGEGISAPFARALLEQGRLPVFWAQMISDLVIDLADKAVTVILVLLLLRLLPQSLGSSLAFTDWKQTPLSHQDRKKARRSVPRQLALRNKIRIVLVAVMLVVATVTTVISTALYRQFAVEQYRNTGRNLAGLAASTIDPEQIDTFLTQGRSNPDYTITEERLQHIMQHSPYISFLYVYQIQEDGCL